MTREEINKSYDNVISIGRIENEKLVRSIGVIKARHEGEECDKYFNLGREKGKSSVDLRDIISRLEKEMPSVEISTESGELILGIPRHIRLEEAYSIISKITEEDLTVSNKTSLFTRNTEDKLEVFRDNVFMNQSGGESVRTAILINPDQVLEFYTDTASRKVTASITRVADYIYEEFINYRHDMERVYHVLDNKKEMLPKLRSEVEVIEADRDHTKVLIWSAGGLAKGFYIEFENDRLYINRS